jgi:hypothetical protein
VDKPINAATAPAATATPTTVKVERNRRRPMFLITSDRKCTSKIARRGQGRFGLWSEGNKPKGQKQDEEDNEEKNHNDTKITKITKITKKKSKSWTVSRWSLSPSS